MDAMIGLYILTGLAAGFIGAMVGLGGGIIVVPALTLLFGLDMKAAISASLISLIATSVMSVMVYAQKEMIHYRLGFILSFATVLGSFAGSYLAVILSATVLMVIFATLQSAAAFHLLKKTIVPGRSVEIISADTTEEGRSSFFKLTGSVFLEKEKRWQLYRIVRLRVGFIFSFFAGLFSGMLGVGGGILQVPVMHLICRVPLKNATATSAFMIGFTGLAGALIFFAFGKIQPILTASLILGILGGAYFGAQTAARIQTKYIAFLLIALLLISAVRLWTKALER